MRQYDLVIVNLAPTIGSEIKKTRPCIIVSPDVMNEALNTVIIIPITSNRRAYATRVEVNHLKIKGRAAIDQIRTVDKKRVTLVHGQIATKTSVEIKAIIEEMLVK